MKNIHQKSFIYYISFLYIANLAAISSGYSIFALSKSLTILGFSKFFIGVTVALPRYILLIISIILLPKADTLNKKRMSLIGAVAGFIAFTGLSFTKNTYLIVLCSALYGFTYTISMTFMISMAMEYIPQEKRMLVMGYFTTSSSLGGFLGPALCDAFFFLGGGAENPNFMFLAGSIFCLAWGIFTVLANFYTKNLIPIVVAAHKEFNGGSNEEEKNPKISTYLPLMPITIIFGLLFSCLMSFLQGFSETLHILSTAQFFLGFGIIALLERFFLAKQFSIWQRHKIIYTGFIFYLSSFLLICFLPVYPFSFTLLMAGILCGAGHGILYPTFTVLFSDMTPNHTGKATFVFLFCFMVGALFNFVIGSIADKWGYQMMFAIVFTTCFVLFMVLMREKRLQTFFGYLQKIQKGK